MTEDPSRPTPEHIMRVEADAELIHSAEAVAEALDRMAREVTAELAEDNPLMLAVMIGGVVPFAELTLRLGFPLEMDYIHATRYRDDVKGGELHWRARPAKALAGRHVVVVDDILDEGLTLAGILRYCRDEGAASVRTAVLVDKRHDRKDGIARADFTGLEAPDRYVFGFGMDYRGYLRNARGIYAVRDL